MIRFLLTALLTTALCAADPVDFGALQWTNDGSTTSAEGTGVFFRVDTSSGGSLGCATAKLPQAGRHVVVGFDLSQHATLRNPNFTIAIGTDNAYVGGGMQLGPNNAWLTTFGTMHTKKELKKGKGEYVNECKGSLDLDLDAKKVVLTLGTWSMESEVPSPPTTIDRIAIMSYKQGIVLKNLTVTVK